MIGQGVSGEAGNLVPDRSVKFLVSCRVAVGQANRELSGVRRLASEKNLPAPLEENTATASE